ncbi:hypothetical protein DNTS_025146 [Danionella cerebrum]|uniref:Recombinase domain-containing protein n=1 Tax=Danionella cerebrum TaxID=2873325 RepID=A0A553R8M1_9TELE|nr:hypothetical protein DNTS_025146 [Danionella translucida]
MCPPRAKLLPSLYALPFLLLVFINTCKQKNCCQGDQWHMFQLVQREARLPSSYFQPTSVWVHFMVTALEPLSLNRVAGYKMERQGINLKQTKTDRSFDPLFIEEEDEDYFEDCLEEIEAALAFPREPMTYTQQCREALQAEFNGLMQQMLTQLDVFDATHSNLSVPVELFSETENKTDTIELPKAFTEASVTMTENVGSARLELSTNVQTPQLRQNFESCIEEVALLERRKDELVQELLELEEPMAQELKAIREALVEQQVLLSKVRLERQRLQEETQNTKRCLFNAARDCTQQQLELELQQKGVEELNQAQEELKPIAAKLLEEIIKIHSDHQSHLMELQKQQRVTQESSKRKTRPYVTQGRRASCDLQQYLQGGIKALEGFYEPRLLCLLKRREVTVDALGKVKEQVQELKAQTAPLRDEEQMLRLQKAQLEERIRLMDGQRRENVEQYREIVDVLEENIRELKMELKIQMKKTNELEALKNSTVKELIFYRESIESPCLQDIGVVDENT